MAAARAAHDGTLQIEAAVAEAASRTLTVAEVAELRGRLLEEQTAAADAIAARHAAAADVTDAGLADCGKRSICCWSLLSSWLSAKVCGHYVVMALAMQQQDDCVAPIHFRLCRLLTRC